MHTATETTFPVEFLEIAQQKDLEWYKPLVGYLMKFHQGTERNYFAGNSLGLQPQGFMQKIQNQALVWLKEQHDGHFYTDDSLKDRPWWRYQEKLVGTGSRLLGALNDPECPEVAFFGSLSPNMRNLLETFFMYIRDISSRDTNDLPTIVTVRENFPSDELALKYALRVVFGHAYRLIEVSRENNGLYDFEKIINVIKTEPNVALGFFPGLCYASGQRFPIRKLTQALHSVGAIAGFDLAHSFGNYQLNLHEAKVDFSVFCGYKYTCGGPGGAGGIYVNKKWFDVPDFHYVSGWFGVHMDDRFNFDPYNYRPAPGAWGFLQSNDPIFNMIGIESFFGLVDEFGEEKIFKKHKEISTFMHVCLQKVDGIKVITPENWEERGCQTSFYLEEADVTEVLKKLNEKNFCERRRDIIRVAPTAYNSFRQCWEFCRDLDSILNG